MAANGGYQTTVGPSACACVNLRRASRAITRLYDKALDPSGLKVTQYSVLANVMRSGPINVTKLALLLKLDRTTLVRNLKPLESAGFLQQVATDDPRERVLAVSEAGRRAVEAASPHWQAVQSQLRDHLGAEFLEQLAVLVTALEEL
jgi:DNA-binding MarR family transcriptional regulator